MLHWECGRTAIAGHAQPPALKIALKPSSLVVAFSASGHTSAIQVCLPILCETAPCLDPTASAMIAVTKLLMLTPSRWASLMSLT